MDLLEATVGSDSSYSSLNCKPAFPSECKKKTQLQQIRKTRRK